MNPATSPTAPRTWIGHWLMLVAALHTVYGVVVFHTELLTMAQLGFVDTVGKDPRRAAVAFFMLFGFLLAVLAIATTALERSGQQAALHTLGWSLLLMCAVAVVLMPASGFWLAGPAVWGLLRGSGAGARSY
jgi:hypothetical protein